MLKKKNFFTLLVADDSAYQNCFLDSFLELAFYSEINYPDFKETSYISPINSGEITDRNIKDIFMFKEFFFHSGKTVGFVLDKEGNATLLDDE